MRTAGARCRESLPGPSPAPPRTETPVRAPSPSSRRGAPRKGWALPVPGALTGGAACGGHGATVHLRASGETRAPLPAKGARPGCPTLPARRSPPPLPCTTAPLHPLPGGSSKARSLPTHTQNGGRRFPTARSAAIADASAMQPFYQSDTAVPRLNDSEEPMETSVVEEEEGRSAAGRDYGFCSPVPQRGGGACWGVDSFSHDTQGHGEDTAVRGALPWR